MSLKLPSMPFVVGVASTVGSMKSFAAGQVTIQSAPPWFDAFIPALTSAVVFGGGVIAAWLVKTVLRVSISASVAWLRARAEAIEHIAKATKDQRDDVTAKEHASVLRTVAKKLEESETSIPNASAPHNPTIFIGKKDLE